MTDIEPIHGGTGGNGAINNRCRLTAEEVRSIRCALANGDKQYYLSLLHGVSQSCISMIARGKTWRHLD